jgi:hypothetical protein
MRRGAINRGLFDGDSATKAIAGILIAKHVISEALAVLTPVIAFAHTVADD